MLAPLSLYMLDIHPLYKAWLVDICLMSHWYRIHYLKHNLYSTYSKVRSKFFRSNSIVPRMLKHNKNSTNQLMSWTKTIKITSTIFESEIHFRF